MAIFNCYVSSPEGTRKIENSSEHCKKKTRFRVVSGARELCTSSSIIAKFRDARFQHGALETSSMGVLRRALSTGGQTPGRQQGDSIISVAWSSCISSTNGDLPYTYIYIYINTYPYMSLSEHRGYAVVQPFQCRKGMMDPH